MPQEQADAHPGAAEPQGEPTRPAVEETLPETALPPAAAPLPGQQYGPAPAQPQGPPQQAPAPWGMSQPQPNQPPAPTQPLQQGPAPAATGPLLPPPLAPMPGPYTQPGQTPVPGQYPQPGQAPAPGQYPQPNQSPLPGQTLPPGYYGGYLHDLPAGDPQTGAGWPPPAAPKRRLPRWLVIGIPILVVVLAAGGYGLVRLLNSPNPAVTKVHCQTQKLTSCLVAAPGSAGLNTSAWDQSVAETGAAYAAEFADAAEVQQPEVESTVSGDGVKAIVHREWSFGSDQVDIILLQFKTIQGAKAWAQDRDGEFLSTDSGQQLTVPGDSTAKAYSSSAPNSSGDYVVHYMTTVGNIDLEVHYASQGSLQQQNFQQWAGTEYASLLTAAAPAPDPSPTPTTFQAATCPGTTLTNCLMPMPAGAVVLPGLPSTYSIDSYTTSIYTGSNVAVVEQTLKSDEVTAIDSEAWGTDEFAKASQVIVLQTRTDAQAQNLLSTLGGVDTTHPDAFSVPGFAQAEGVYEPSPSSGTTVDDGWVDAQAGNLFLSMWFGFNATFDAATAKTWATTELDLLSVRTQSHWGFPIPQVSTPTLAPFAADSCTATSLSGCLMSLPSGATANTSGGANPQDPGVAGFADTLYHGKSTYEATWLSGDGASDAVSESWTAKDGASATDYLLSFPSGRQAEAAALQEAGDNLVGSQSCTVATLPDTYCVVLPENDSTGAVTIWVTGWGAKRGFALEVTQTDGADTADALKWAQIQAELLAG